METKEKFNLVQRVLTDEEVRVAGDYKRMVEVLNSFKPGEYIFIDNKNGMPSWDPWCKRVTPKEIVENLRKEGLCIEEKDLGIFGYAVIVLRDKSEKREKIMIYRK